MENNEVEITKKNISNKILRLMNQFKYSIIFISILIIGTIIFKIQDGKIDILIINHFYNRNLPLGNRFPLEKVQPWYFLNEYNDYFEYFFYITILPMILVGFIKWKKWKYITYHGIYAFVSTLVGVWLIVNELFKNFYGRPRPRQTYLWPNSADAEMWDFYSVWEPAFLKDPSLIDAGKAFPSGHVAIVAAFIIYYFLFRNPEFWAKQVQIGTYSTKMKLFTTIKWTGFSISIILGVLTGIGRIVVGAHHPSDVLWAFGMVYIVDAVFYYWIFRIPKFEKKMLQ